MSLVINHNLMAMNTARNLNNTYDRLSSSVQRLSSGLRINSAADDAAGLAIRELMRADISTMQQGIRNAADAISMIQTADGAMAVIDEKLVRMKELAEQASTGTYTTLQREIINSEYQAMAAEIDRIAAATNFNGVKLLDGSITNLHGGQGMKIHFGVGNNPAEDYYFLTMGDVRATSNTGLRIGGDAKNDIWGQGAAGATGLAGPGCCTAGYDSLDGPAGFTSGQTFAYGYNWDWMEYDDPDLLTGKYLAGRYTVGSSESLQDLINKVNKGTQSRVGVQLDGSALAAAIKNGGTAAVCVGDEAYIFGSATVAGGTTIIPPVSGQTFEYLAKGKYIGAAFLANLMQGSSGYGFALTSAQIASLKAAGLDLSKLGLASAMVSASASSLVNSAQARTKLLLNLSNAFKALGLSSFSAIATESGVTDGFKITSANFKASANAAIVTNDTMSATIKDNQTLRVHTGVYADVNGNWTDSARIANALGLSEVVFNIRNQDAARWVTSVTNYASLTQAISKDGSIVYQGSAQDLKDAGLDFAGTNLQGTFTATSTSGAAASAELYAKFKAAWEAKYANVDYTLAFTQDNGNALVTGKTASQMIASAQQANPSFTLTGDVPDDTQTFAVSVNVWTDTNGNFTTDKATAEALGFQRMIYTFTRNAAVYDIKLNGATLAAPATDPLLAAATAPNASTTMDGTNGIAELIQGSIRAQIAAKQGAAATPNEQGEVTLATRGGALWAPSAADLSAVKTKLHQPPVGNDLTVTVDIAGETKDINDPFGKALLGFDRKKTTLGELVTATATALSQILSDYQDNALKADLEHMGRIVTTGATPPSGPENDISKVTDLNESSRFHSGVLDRSVATGTYNDDGYVFSSATNYGLSKDQFKALRDAGVDLEKLLLVSAMITTSASSPVGSASARALLLDKIKNMWTALALETYSAITISAKVTTGFSALTSTQITASAQAGALGSGATGETVLKDLRSMVVHTGIYSDDKGNWTDDASLAKDLGLSEITYTVANNNVTWYTTSADFTSKDYFVSGSILADSAVLSALQADGIFSTATGPFNACSAHIKGSGATAIEASVNLFLSGVSVWQNKYKDAHSSLAFDLTDHGGAILAPELKYIAQSADQTNVDVPGAGGKILAGQTLTVHTGIYEHANGSWTDDAELAAMFGFTEIKYEVTNNAGVYDYGSAGTVFAAGLPVVAVGDMGTQIRDYLRARLNAKATATNGKLSATQQAGPAAPTKEQLDALKSPNPPQDHTINTLSPTDPARTGKLDITITIAGVSTGVFSTWSPPTLDSTIVMKDLAKELSDEISNSLDFLQKQAATGTNSGMGRLHKANPTLPAAPKDEKDLTNFDVKDIYKDASKQQTVTKTGIVDKYKYVTLVASAGTSYTNTSGVSNFGAWALASAINHNKNSQFWAMVQPFDSDGKSADMVYIFTKDGGDYNSLLACDVADGDIASREALSAISFENTETDRHSQSGTNFSLGGQNWATFKPIQTRGGMGKEVWNLTIHGRDVGKERDLWIAAMTNGENEVKTPGLNHDIINGLDRYSFVEIQNADNGPWTGAEVRTQSSAQQALDAINDAMARKDKVRADIGALQNRLENTITNLEIQVEALQQSESRISDVDMATEMTEFVRNQVLSQAAISMLSQANSLPQMALSLLNG
jgi:flagellin-like hook-associated protein FlgL